MDRRNILKLFAATGAAGMMAPALAACSSPTAAQVRSTQTLRIGLVYPQSGPLQDVGFEMLNGFKLFLLVNGNQIGGMTAQIVAIDEGATAKSGQAAIAAALKQGNIDVLVGIANSEVMALIPDAVTAARVPLLGTYGSPASLRSSDFIWRTSFVNGEASKALGVYLTSLAPSVSMQTVGTLARPSSIVVYDDGSADAIAEAAAFTTQLAATGIHLHPVHGDPTSPSVIGKVASWHSDLVYAAASSENAPAFIKAYRGRNISAPLCGPGALTELGAQQSGANKVFTSMNYGADLGNDANQQFTSAYFAQNNGKVPTTYAMTTYDAAAVLDAAIGLVTGDVTSLTINAALGSAGVFDSPRGRWQFNQSRTPLQQWYLRQVRSDGRFLENTVLADLATLT
jgi:branched-chain amino acid transport system substrate-binding protein